MGDRSLSKGHTTSTDYGGLSHLTELDSTHICSSMEPVSATILALVDKSGPNPLLDTLQSLLQDPDPDWVYPSCEWNAYIMSPTSLSHLKSSKTIWIQGTSGFIQRTPSCHQSVPKDLPENRTGGALQLPYWRKQCRDVFCGPEQDLT